LCENYVKQNRKLQNLPPKCYLYIGFGVPISRRDEKGIRCKSGTVPAAVSSLETAKWKISNRNTFCLPTSFLQPHATVPHLGGREGAQKVEQVRRPASANVSLLSSG
jgi:hypothetical protein